MILLSTLVWIPSDLWQQLELASELESDLQGTANWWRKWLVNFSARKTQLVSFDWSNNSGGNNGKVDGSVLEENLSLKILVLPFSSKLDLGSYIVSIAIWSFFVPKMLFISLNLPYVPACNTIVMSGGDVPSCYLGMLDKLQKWLCLNVCPTFATSLDYLGHCRNVTSLVFFYYRYYFGSITLIDAHWNWLKRFCLLILMGGPLVI